MLLYGSVTRRALSANELMYEILIKALAGSLLLFWNSNVYYHKGRHVETWLYHAKSRSIAKRVMNGDVQPETLTDFEANMRGLAGIVVVPLSYRSESEGSIRGAKRQLGPLIGLSKNLGDCQLYRAATPGVGTHLINSQ